jgi:hypothetical protein
MPIQNRAYPGCNPTPTREPMGRRGRDETLDERGDLQAPSHTEDQRQMGHRRNLLHCKGQEVPPGVASPLTAS